MSAVSLSLNVDVDGETRTVTIPTHEGPVPEPEMVTVPEADTNLWHNFSRCALLGLDRRVYAEKPYLIKAGALVSMEPASGERVPAGSVVKVTYSAGADPSVIPDVIGLDDDYLPTGNHFSYNTSYETNASVPRGHVIRQSPAPGTPCASTGYVNVSIVVSY